MRSLFISAALAALIGLQLVAGSASAAQTWSALGSTSPGVGALNGQVYDEAIYKGDLYAVGTFTNAAGIAAADYIARWDGGAWHSLDSNGGNGSLTAAATSLAVWNGDLYIGGDFVNADGIATADYLAKWDGTNWSNVSSNGSGNGALDSVVSALGSDANYLYVSGFFANVGGIDDADYVARWNGNWSAVGTGPNGRPLNSSAHTIVAGGGKVYFGGTFTNAAGIANADHLAVWNGTTWSALGPTAAFTGNVFAIAVIGSNVFVGGDFQNAAGIAKADNLARWNGKAWSAVGSNGANAALDDPVLDLLPFGTDLYAAGGFEDAGGQVHASIVARWNGATWNALGNPLFTAQVNALAATAATLFAGGYFLNASGIAEADRVAAFGPLTMNQPDGRIQVGASALAGNDIYNDTGKSQSKTGSGAVAATITFGISVQNDGFGSDSFKLHATGTATTKFTVQYFDGASDITSAVVNGTYSTGSLVSGATKLITAKVKVNAGAAVGAKVTRLVTVSSVNEPSKVDVVKLVAKRS